MGWELQKSRWAKGLNLLPRECEVLDGGNKHICWIDPGGRGLNCIEKISFQYNPVMYQVALLNRKRVSFESDEVEAKGLTTETSCCNIF